MDWSKEYWNNSTDGKLAVFEAVRFEIGCSYSKIIYY